MPKKNGKIRVGIADQHSAVRKGIIATLSAHRRLAVVGEAGDGREAVKLVKRLKPDVLITDILMPKLNGLQAAHQIIKHSPCTRILIFSADYRDYYIQQAVQLHVAGFLIKSTEVEALPSAIITIQEGKSVFSPVIERHIRRHIGFPGYEKGEQHASHLTTRELDVLSLMTLRDKEIAYDLNLSLKTVERHIKHMKTKLDLPDRASLITYAIDTGISQGKA